MAREYDIRPPQRRRKPWPNLSRAYKLSLARKYDTRPKQERRIAPLFTLPARDRASFKKPEYRTPTERRYVQPQRRSIEHSRPDYGPALERERQRRLQEQRYDEENASVARRRELGDNKISYGYSLEEFQNLEHQENYSYYAIYTKYGKGKSPKTGQVLEYRMEMGPVSDDPDEIVELVESDLEEDDQITAVTIYANPTRGDMRTWSGRYPTEADYQREAVKRDVKPLGGGEKYIRYGDEPRPYKQTKR